MKKILCACLVGLAFLAAASLARAGIPIIIMDDDGDGYSNGTDNCQKVRNGDCGAYAFVCDINKDGVVSPEEQKAGNQADWNDNGIGDACDDSDQDGVVDYLDNCPVTANASQDPGACIDTDKDGFEDAVDNCPRQINPDQKDRDGDGIGDWCDNCKYVSNPDQIDADDDGFGDACIEDADGDGVTDSVDNCPMDFNPGQEDSGGGIRGDACEPQVDSSSESPEENVTPAMNFGSSSCSLISEVAKSDASQVIAILLSVCSLGVLAYGRKYQG